ncbi:hypothetical protein E3T42_06345 [Cryobacterium sp. TMT4-10]|nr:hypothetical protein E3T42_06345 [Cryobacterium sp. TMT4-10]
MPGTPGAMLVRGGAPGGAWRHGPAPGDAVSGHGCRGARSARRRRLEPAPRATSCATSHEPRATSHEPRATSHEPRATGSRARQPRRASVVWAPPASSPLPIEFDSRT